MKLIKSYNTFGNLLVVNVMKKETKQKYIYLIPLNIATLEFDLCLNCEDTIFSDDEIDENELKPLFDGFDYVEINSIRLFELLNSGKLEEYLLDDSTLSDIELFANLEN